MATVFSQKDNDSAFYAVAQAFNQLHDKVAAGFTSTGGSTGLSPTGYFHRDISSSVATGSDWQHPLGAPLLVAPLGATGATVISQSLYNAALNIRGVLLEHFADDSAHVLADSVNATGLASIQLPLSASDATGVPFLINQERTFFNAHLTQTVPTAPLGIANGNLFGPVGPVQVHVNNDLVNSVNTATAVGLTGPSFLLVSAMASGLSAHMANGPSFGRVKFIK